MKNIKEFFTYCFKKTGKSIWNLLKLMIPVSIIIHCIQLAGILPYLSNILSPIMKVVNLPVETALVWVTAMVVNIYGGLLSLFSIYSSLAEPLTVAQMTTLLTMILIAHTFPIELGIANKTGIKVWVMFLIRFGCGIIASIFLAWFYKATNWCQTPVTIANTFSADTPTWSSWALHELKNYGMIACIIFTLVTLIHLLEVTGAINWLNKLILPALQWLGISSTMLPLTVAGLSLGIAYGGGLIIEEGKRPDVKAKDIFYAMTLMGVFHSIFEDTILMLSMGGHWSGIIVFRMLFAFLVTYIIMRWCNSQSDETFDRRVMTKSYRKHKQTILTQQINKNN